MALVVVLVVVLVVLVWQPQAVALGGSSCPLAELSLEGDYLLGGLFQLHQIHAGSHVMQSRRAEALSCERLDFSAASYQQIQVMRFAVEKINNSSRLLPGLTLGYRIFDYCDVMLSFPAALQLLSERVVSVTGPFGSSQTLSVAPLFMAQLIPMVTHGASSVQLSDKARFPSFFRTIPSDINQVKAVVSLLQTFQWNWVAFIGGDNDYSRDALAVFRHEIRTADDVCLAFHATITSRHRRASTLAILARLSRLGVRVAVVFANVEFAVPFLRTAAERGVTGTVWIASEAWSRNGALLAALGRGSRGFRGSGPPGTVLGVALRGGGGELPGLEDFLFSRRRGGAAACAPRGAGLSCVQACPDCGGAGGEGETLANQDGSFTHAIHAAVQAVARALHATLNCSRHGCPGNATARPAMVTEALKRVSFRLDGAAVKFDQYGDPPAAFDIVYWDWTSGPPYIQTIGSYRTDQTPRFSVDAARITWFDGTKTAPMLQCSSKCLPGSRMVQTGFHSCCFECHVCPDDTYVNSTECVACEEDEWSLSNSTSCTKRAERFLRFSSPLALALLLSAALVPPVSAAIAALFARHANSPVVRSAGGGRLCAFMLASLSASSLGAALHAGPPSATVCALRLPVFVVCYGAALACLAARSFQIVCVFKMAARLPPRAHAAWARCCGGGGGWGQRVAVSTCTAALLLLCVLWAAVGGPRPLRTNRGREVILECSVGAQAAFYPVVAAVALLSVACFLFAYAGMDLPKNYNEGRCVTFSLLLFFLACAGALTLNLTRRGGNEGVDAGAILVSLYAVLLGYFLPKCYIIVLRPERNTAAYFQTAIQSYTLQPR